MNTGLYTGVKLSTYFNDVKTDPINARKIINGLDCADKICDYYNKFYNSIVWKKSIGKMSLIIGLAIINLFQNCGYYEWC